MKKNKKFFLSSTEQKSKFSEATKQFGKDQVSFLDCIVGGNVPTSGDYMMQFAEVYAESTYVRTS